ncbi:MAG: hypothetical protein U0O25_01835 [Succinivibrio sp.]|uniref:hypothetical protein n=1 Tax=Succinivibrio sp. TaxID=2053619 RepID=UPI002F93C11E
MDTYIYSINPNECVTREKRDLLAEGLVRLSRQLAYYEKLKEKREFCEKYNANWEAFKCVVGSILVVLAANLIVFLSGLVPDEVFSIIANASLVIGGVYCVVGVYSSYSQIEKFNFIANNSNRILNSHRCYTLYNHVYSFFDDGEVKSENALCYANFIKSGKCSSLEEAKEHLRYLNRKQFNENDAQVISATSC